MIDDALDRILRSVYKEPDEEAVLCIKPSQAFQIVDLGI